VPLVLKTNSEESTLSGSLGHSMKRQTAHSTVQVLTSLLSESKLNYLRSIYKGVKCALIESTYSGSIDESTKRQIAHRTSQVLTSLLSCFIWTQLPTGRTTRVLRG